MIDEFPWLKDTWQFLLDAEETGRLSQAYLFKSQEKLGASILIEKMAKGLICVQKGIRSCDDCRTCTLFESRNLPDVKRLELTEKNSSITVDSVRDLKNFFSTRPAFASFKIALIDPIERLNFFAINALLKLLEEPPKNTFFLLNWESPKPVPRTLTSRCQQVLIPSPSRECALTWLERNGTHLKDILVEDSLFVGSPLEILAQIKGIDTKPPVLREALMDVFAIGRGHRNIVKLSEKYSDYTPVELVTGMELLCHAISSLKHSKLPRKLILSEKQEFNLQWLADNLELTQICELNLYFLDIKAKCFMSDGLKAGDLVETLFFKWMGVLREIK